MTLRESESMDTETQTPAALKPDRRTSRIDTDKRTIAIIDGGATETFGLDGIPEAARTHLALIGLRQWLRQRDNAATDYDKLARGELGVETRAPAKPKALRPWQEATALAMAEKAAKARNITARKFGKETPEFAALLVEAREHVDGMDRAALAAARRNPAVIAHHARIAGAEVDALPDLLG